MSIRLSSIYKGILCLFSVDYSSSLGYFGFVYLNDDQIKSFRVNIESNSIDRMDQQCLIYYYYMPNMGEKIISVRKEETNGDSEIIDSVTTSPFNGWVQRKISFNVQRPNYKVRYLRRNILFKLIFLAII